MDKSNKCDPLKHIHIVQERLLFVRNQEHTLYAEERGEYEREKE